MSVWIRWSKADHLGLSHVGNHYRIEGAEGACPVASVEQVRRYFPQRFDNGPESQDLLVRFASGKTLFRDLIFTFSIAAPGVDMNES